jgi:hypothetical protein
MKAKVTERALLQRINRKLKADGERIVKPRLPDPELGQYFIRTEQAVTRRNIDPVKLAREIGCLQTWEKAEL